MGLEGGEEKDCEKILIPPPPSPLHKKSIRNFPSLLGEGDVDFSDFHPLFLSWNIDVSPAVLLEKLFLSISVGVQRCLQRENFNMKIKEKRKLLAFYFAKPGTEKEKRRKSTQAKARNNPAKRGERQEEE